MTADDGYEAWLRSNPAPDLQDLVEHHGGYSNITPEAWAEHDRAIAEWQERRRTRLAGAPSSEISNSKQSDPEALCLCGLPGVYMRPRKGGGRPIWRCEQHRSQWPDYAHHIPATRRASAPRERSVK
jgi:hypothetical protein